MVNVTVTADGKPVPHKQKPMRYRHRIRWKGRTFVVKGIACWVIELDSSTVIENAGKTFTATYGVNAIVGTSTKGPLPPLILNKQDPEESGVIRCLAPDALECIMGGGCDQYGCRREPI